VIKNVKQTPTIYGNYEYAQMVVITVTVAVKEVVGVN
jgi:hypothetical protein